MNKNLIPGTGAQKSKKDKRNIQHKDVAFAGLPLVTGGIHYLPQDIEHQHLVGICIGISSVQYRQKQTGKKYSPDFFYFLMKKYYDIGFYEGSSYLSANKVAKKYGFLPKELWTYTTEQDRLLPYTQYITKLQAIPDSEIQRLIGLCVDQVAGYAQVDVTDAQAIAKAINESINQSGILCRYGCQDYWWTPSWLPKDINPLRWKPETSGHGIINSFFDYSTGVHMQELQNTWGTTWCKEGRADINWDTYKMNEAWVYLLTNPMFQFNKTLKYGMRDPDVKELQKRLNMFSWNQTGFFGTLTLLAVKKYQKSKGLTVDGIVGPNTRKELNK